MARKIVVRDPDILGGTAVFAGTRVPFQALLDYLEGGQTIAEFLDDFPTVTHDDAVARWTKPARCLSASLHESAAGRVCPA